MPSRRPPTVRTRDQIVSFETQSAEGKQRMIAELARIAGDAGLRIGRAETSIDGLREDLDALDAEVDTLVLTGPVPSSRLINTTSPLAGGGSLASDLTLSLLDNGISDAKLRDSSALSVIGRALSTAGDPADILAGSDGDVLRRSGTTLGFGAIPESSVTDLVADLAARPTGSGTTNTIPKWTGASVLGDSGITDDGSLVTISPTVLMSDSLQVVGDIHTLGSGTIEGTLTLPLMTPGSVLFAGSGGLVSEDNAGLHYDDAGNWLGVGTNTRSDNLAFPGGGTVATLETEVPGASSFVTASAFSASSVAGTFVGVRGRGTRAAPAAVTTGDQLAVFTGSGYAASTVNRFATGGQFRVTADGAWSTTSFPARLEFLTVPSAGTTPLQRMTVFNSGNVNIGGTVSDPGVLLRVEGALTTLGNATLGDSTLSDAHTVNGTFLITSTAATRALHVRGNSDTTGRVIATFNANSSGAGGMIQISDGNIWNWGIGGANTTNDFEIRDGTFVGTAGTTRLRISKSTGKVTALADFGVDGNATIGNASGDAHSLTGTLNLNATAGSNGQIAQVSGGVPVWAAPSTASIPTGTGTNNTLVKWTGASTQGNSSITDTGSLVTASVNTTVSRDDAGSHANRPILAVTNSASTGSFAHRADLQFNVYDETNVARQSYIRASGDDLEVTTAGGELITRASLVRAIGTGGSSGLTPTSSVVALIENTGGNSYLGFLNNTNASGIEFGNSTSTTDGRILYDASRNLSFRVAGATRQTIDSSGNTTFTGALAVNGNATIGDTNADVHVINGRFSVTPTNGSTAAMLCNNTLTGLTNETRALQTGHTGSYNTTAGALTSTGAVITVDSTRSAGANDLTNRALFLRASGAQNNYAMIVQGGMVGIHTLTPTNPLEVVGATRLDGQLNVTGTCTLGDSTADTHTVNGNTTFNVPSGGTGFVNINAPGQERGLKIQQSGTEVAAFTASSSTGEVKVGATAASGTYFLTLWSGGAERARITTAGAATFYGNVTLGDASTDVITVNGGTSFNAGAGFFSGLSTTYIGSTDSLADVFIESRGGGNGRIYLDSDNIEIGATTQGAAVGALGDGNLLLNGTLKVSNTAATISSGTGTPEGAVTAEVGSLYMRTDGGAGTSLYVKESGSGNTGWVAK